MRKIKGNITALLQTKTGAVKNEIGEVVPKWETAYTLVGFLDLSSGDSKYSSYNAKIQESTHIFVCDYQELTAVTAENSRLIINGKVYDVMLIDAPMELHYQLEFYLKFTGSQ